MKTKIYFYCIDGFADWEAGLVLAELTSGRFFRKDAPPLATKTFGLGTAPVRTLGGLQVAPALDIADVRADDAALLILPGSDNWLDPRQKAVAALAKDFLARGIPVAAICGATLALAQAGLLDQRPHTSNDLGFLKHCCPNYKGESHYRTAPVVCDKGLITATGTASLEFAHAIIKTLNVFDDAVQETWLNLFRTHEGRHFYRLMELLGHNKGN